MNHIINTAITMLWLTNQADGREDVIRDMTLIAVNAGLPSACLTQADECLAHNEMESYEYYLDVAAKNGSKEAAAKLREYRKITGARKTKA